MKYKSKFRLDILLAISFPLLCSYAYIYLDNKREVNIVELYISAILIVLGILLEVLFLKEDINTKSKDTGFISGFVISSIISFLILNNIYFELLLYTSSSKLVFYLGCLIFILGLINRFYSKFFLGQYFSHSIRILKDHKLVTHGIYSFIRHPAYTGTIFLIFGSSLMFHSFFGIILLLVILPMILIRISNEENILTEKFADEYTNYKRNTKKLLPFVY